MMLILRMPRTAVRIFVKEMCSSLFCVDIEVEVADVEVDVVQVGGRGWVKSLHTFRPPPGLHLRWSLRQ